MPTQPVVPVTSALVTTAPVKAALVTATENPCIPVTASLSALQCLVLQLLSQIQKQLDHILCKLSMTALYHLIKPFKKNTFLVFT